MSLLWVDFRELALDEKTLDKVLVNEAKVWLDNGLSFGDNGKGFRRMNVAVPFKVLKRALSNMKCALEKY